MFYEPLTPLKLAFEKIKKTSNKFIAIFSNNDEYVPFEENSRTYKEKLGAKIITETKKGHFGGEDNITELPSVLNALLEISK